MAQNLQIYRDIMEDLLERIKAPRQKYRRGREELRDRTGDSDWSSGLIRQDGIDVIAALLHNKKLHISVVEPF